MYVLLNIFGGLHWVIDKPYTVYKPSYTYKQFYSFIYIADR